jgi:hypothetical protein
MARNLFEVTPLFGIGLLLGIFASVLYFLMRARVVNAGVPVKWFGTWRELQRVLRIYKELAPGKGWALWPIAGYWISVAAMVVLGLILGLSSRPK